MNGKLKILLIASLALNLFAVGGVVGALVMGARLKPTRTFVSFGGGGRDAGPGPVSPMRAPSVLGPEEGQALRARLREAAEAGQADREAAREARRQAVQLIANQPYDARAVEAAFAKARASELSARARIEAALADGLQGVDQPRRAELAERMKRDTRMGRRGGRPDHDGDRPPGPPPSPQGD